MTGTPIEPTPPNPSEETEGKNAGTEVSVEAMERINLLLVAIAAGLGFFWGSHKALAIFVGGALMAGCFRITIMAMRALFIKEEAKRWPLVIYWLKFTSIIAIVGVLVFKFEIDPAGFLIGLSLIVVAIVAEAVRKLAA